MEKAEFTALPLSIALGILYDANARALATVEAPRVPQSPKFDSRIRRKGGYQWASETDAEGLRFWHTKAQQPAMDPKYEEKNAREAKALGYFLAWREANPTAIWRGERNREQVTAKPPAAKPEVYPWEERPRQAAAELTDDGYDSETPF